MHSSLEDSTIIVIRAVAGTFLVLDGIEWQLIMHKVTCVRTVNSA